MAGRISLNCYRPFIECCRPSRPWPPPRATASTSYTTSCRETLHIVDTPSTSEGIDKEPSREAVIHLFLSRPSQIPWHSPSLIESYESILPPDELAKIKPEEGWHAQASSDADRALQDKRRERLLSKVLTRCCLAQTLSLYHHNSSASSSPPSPRGLCFDVNPHGKPLLIQADPSSVPSSALLHHNSSNTTGLVGCAVSQFGPIGFDLELIRRKSLASARGIHTTTSSSSSSSPPGPSLSHADSQTQSWMKLAKRRFSPSEYEALKQLSSEDERSLMFVKLWTLKEAFVKCRGTGISAKPGLGSFSLSMGSQPLSQAALLRSGLEDCIVNDQPVVEISLQLSDAFLDHERQQLQTRSEGGEELKSGLAVASDYHFLLLQPSPDHIAAICYQRSAIQGSSSHLAVHTQHCMPTEKGLQEDRPYPTRLLAMSII